MFCIFLSTSVGNFYLFLFTKIKPNQTLWFPEDSALFTSWVFPSARGMPRFSALWKKALSSIAYSSGEQTSWHRRCQTSLLARISAIFRQGYPLHFLHRDTVSVAWHSRIPYAQCLSGVHPLHRISSAETTVSRQPIRCHHVSWSYQHRYVVYQEDLPNATGLPHDAHPSRFRYIRRTECPA